MGRRNVHRHSGIWGNVPATCKVTQHPTISGGNGVQLISRRLTDSLLSTRSPDGGAGSPPFIAVHVCRPLQNPRTQGLEPATLC